MALLEKTQRGVFCTFAGRGTNEVLHLAFSVCLARLLAPADFGAYGFCLVLSGLASQLSFLGLAAGVSLKKTLCPGEVAAVYSTSLCFAVAAFALFAAGGSLLGLLRTDFDLAALAPFMGWIVFCEAAWTVPLRLLERRFAFGLVGMLRITGTLAAGALQVALAIEGHAVFSLLAGRFLQNMIQLVGFTAASAGDLRLSRRLVQAGDLLRFGGWVWLKNLCNYLTGNCDYFFVQLYHGSSALGLYERAYRLVLLPMKQVSRQLSRVTRVALSKRQDDAEAVARANRQLFSHLGIMLYPALFGMFVTAPELIPVAFGPQWVESVDLMRVLCVVGIVRALLLFVEDVPIALGRPRAVALPLAAHALAAIAACGILVRYGLLATCVTMVGVVVVRVAVSLRVWETVAGAAMRNVLLPQVPALTGATVMLAACLACRRLLLGVPGVGATARLVATAACGVLVYGAVMLALFPESVRSFRGELLGILRSGGRGRRVRVKSAR